MRLQQAVAVARGVALAHKAGDLPDGYADALATSDEEADEITFQVNADRKMDAIVARLGGR